MRHLDIFLTALGLVILLTTDLAAQDSCPPNTPNCLNVAKEGGYFGPQKVDVTLDYLTSIPEKEIPFDRWFYIKKIVCKDEIVSSIAIHGHQYTTEPLCFEQKPVKDQPDFAEVTIAVPPLNPNSAYYLLMATSPNETKRENLWEIFTAIHKNNNRKADAIIAFMKKNSQQFIPTTQEFTNYYKEYLAKNFTNFFKESSPDEGNTIKKEILSIIDRQPITVRTGRGIEQITFNGIQNIALSSETYNLQTRAQYILVPDVGYVYYGFNSKFSGATPYVGVSINFRSFDPNIPMRRIKGLQPWHYLSLQLGLTFGSVAKAGYRENLLGNRTLMTGLGIRINHAVKLNAGTLLYRKLDVNPLIDRAPVNIVPYVGLSVDLRINEIAKDLGTIFSGNVLPVVR